MAKKILWTCLFLEYDGEGSLTSLFCQMGRLNTWGNIEWTGWEFAWEDWPYVWKGSSGKEGCSYACRKKILAQRIVVQRVIGLLGREVSRKVELRLLDKLDLPVWVVNVLKCLTGDLQ